MVDSVFVVLKFGEKNPKTDLLLFFMCQLKFILQNKPKQQHPHCHNVFVTLGFALFSFFFVCTRISLILFSFVKFTSSCEHL